MSEKNITPAAIQAAVSGNIEDFIAASTPGCIEAQEASGQQSFTVDQTLPKECPREMLEEIGFVFGDDEDDIFVNVKFPEGWEKKPTEHSMWNDLLDEKGRKRGAIFYKAAFYDRSAHMYLVNRFSLRMDYDIDDAVQFVIEDCGEVVHRLDKVVCEKYTDDYWEAERMQMESANNWLNEKYPEWKSKLSYWD